MIVPVYVINLPEDVTQFAAIHAQVDVYPFLDLIRVEGVRGRYLPDIVARTLARNKWAVNHKGVLACFMAHARVWERIAKSDAAFGLVLEDDAQLRQLECLETLTLPIDADIVWCNERTTYPHVAEEGDGTRFRSFLPALDHVARNRSSVGAYGYLMSSGGARKLLSFIETDSFMSHVDLRLAAYANDPVHPHGDEGMISMRRHFAPEHRLIAYSLWPALAYHPHADSRRIVEDDQGSPGTVE